MNSVCFNGKMIPADAPVLPASNRGYRYGDGLFETIRIVNGGILLKNYHFERLFSGLSLLQFEIPVLFSQEKLEKEILSLCHKNGCEKSARVRLSVSRGNGGLYDEDRSLQYLIECWPLDETINKLNENGLVLGVYPGARKACDQFSGLKSASFLPYSMAAIYAKQNRLNDCLVLNTYDRVADSTIANLFIIKDGLISTPSLQEGCINGVMRRHLLTVLPSLGYTVNEVKLSVPGIETADEVFLTNAIRGIRWVAQLGNSTYTNTRTIEIYQHLA
ncbi:MAG: aminotransferase class IV [Chitinophagaceae bacterium]